MGGELVRLADRLLVLTPAGGAGLPPIGFVGATASSGTTTTRAGTVPAGTQAGDVMVAFVGNYYNISSPTITPPSGWTQQGATQNPGSTNRTVAMYTRVAGASEPASYTWTFSGATINSVTIISLRHVSNSTPVNTAATFNVAAGTAVTNVSMSMTPSSPNCAVVSCVWVSGAEGSFSLSAAFTSGATVLTNAAAGVAYDIQTTATAASNNWTWPTSQICTGGMIALNNG